MFLNKYAVDTKATKLSKDQVNEIFEHEGDSFSSIVRTRILNQIPVSIMEYGGKWFSDLIENKKEKKTEVEDLQPWILFGDFLRLYSQTKDQHLGISHVKEICSALIRGIGLWQIKYGGESHSKVVEHEDPQIRVSLYHLLFTGVAWLYRYLDKSTTKYYYFELEFKECERICKSTIRFVDEADAKYRNEEVEDKWADWESQHLNFDTGREHMFERLEGVTTALDQILLFKEKYLFQEVASLVDEIHDFKTVHLSKKEKETLDKAKQYCISLQALDFEKQFSLATERVFNFEKAQKIPTWRYHGFSSLGPFKLAPIENIDNFFIKSGTFYNRICELTTTFQDHLENCFEKQYFESVFKIKRKTMAPSLITDTMQIREHNSNGSGANTHHKKHHGHGGSGGFTSKPVPVTIRNKTKRKLIRIPHDAVYFSWVYPILDEFWEDKFDEKKLPPQEQKHGDNFINALVFLVNGGFVYFNANKEICGVNSLSYPGAQMAFSVPKPFDDIPTSVIDQLDHPDGTDVADTEWQDITISYFKDASLWPNGSRAVKFAWINPGLTSENSSGCFAYKCEDPKYNRYFEVVEIG